MNYADNVNVTSMKTGASISAPVNETPVNESYMNLQAQSEQVEPVTPEEIIEPVRIKPYTFRKLNSTDLFPMIRIISKIGLDELTEAIDGDVIDNLLNTAKDKVKNVEDGTVEDDGVNEIVDETETTDDISFIVGVGAALKLANKILEHIPSCETEIYTLISRVSGMTVDEVKAVDIDIFLEMLMDFVMKEEFKSFFKAASKLLKR